MSTNNLLSQATGKADSILNSSYNSSSTAGTTRQIETTGGSGISPTAQNYKASQPSSTLGNISAVTQVALGVGSLVKAGATAVKDVFGSASGVKTNPATAPSRINIVDKKTNVETVVDEKASQKTSFITYPVDLSSDYCFRLTFYEFERFYKISETNVNVKDVVRLPLPSNLVDSVSIQYNNLEMGALRGELLPAVSDVADTFMQSGAADAAAEAYKGLMKAIQDPKLAQLLGRRALGGVSREAASALDLALGNTPNPHQIITFNGVNLRSYQFTWRFSPNNDRDSKALKDLIFYMKRRTLPRKDNNFFLKYPDVVRLKVFPAVLNDLFNFRTMVVDSFLVNYAPSGNLSFLADDMPSEVEVSMTLKEVDIQTADDYPADSQQISRADQAATTNYA